MDLVFANLLDVVRIVTFQPTTVSTERERIAQERFRSTDAVIAEDPRPAASPGAEQKPRGLRGWLRFSFVPRL